MAKKVKVIIAITSVTVIAVSLISIIEYKKYTNKYENRAEKNILVVKDDNINLKNVDNILYNEIKSLKDEFGEEFEKELNKKIKETNGTEKRALERTKEDLIKKRKNISEKITKQKILATKARELKLIPEERMDELAKEANVIVMAFLDNHENFKTDENKEKAKRIFTEAYIETVLAYEMKMKITSEIQIKEKDSKDYYNQNIEDYKSYGGFTVERILIPYDSSEIANNLADELFDDISLHGKDFQYIIDKVNNPENVRFESAVIENIEIRNDGGNDKKYFETLLRSQQSIEPGDEKYMGKHWKVKIFGERGVYITKVLEYREKDKTIPYEDVKIEIESKLINDRKELEIENRIKEYAKEFNVKYKDSIVSF